MGESDAHQQGYTRARSRYILQLLVGGNGERELLSAVESVLVKDYTLRMSRVGNALLVIRSPGLVTYFRDWKGIY